MGESEPSQQKLVVVTPCYQDVPSFSLLRDEVRRELAGRADTAAMDLRFIVIDDTAGQDPAIAGLECLEDVTVIEPPFNLGHQRGLVYGLRSSAPGFGTGDLIVTLDADGEDRPADILRMLDPLLVPGVSPATVVLAARTSRQESLVFKFFYVIFRLMFRILTGTTIRSGNFAAYRGSVVQKLLRHPHFDLCYSSSFISLDVPVVFVPCPRGTRYEGRSRMNRARLTMHGLRMLMPFVDRIALRALAGLAGLVFLAVTVLVALGSLWVFTDLRLSNWLLGVSLALLVSAFLGIACCIILFALFAQSRGISLNGLEVTDERLARSTSARPG